MCILSRIVKTAVWCAVLIASFSISFAQPKQTGYEKLKAKGFTEQIGPGEATIAGEAVFYLPEGYAYLETNNIKDFSQNIVHKTVFHKVRKGIGGEILRIEGRHQPEFFYILYINTGYLNDDDIGFFLQQNQWERATLIGNIIYPNVVEEEPVYNKENHTISFQLAYINNGIKYWTIPATVFLGKNGIVLAFAKIHNTTHPSAVSYARNLLQVEFLPGKKYQDYGLYPEVEEEPEKLGASLIYIFIVLVVLLGFYVFFIHSRQNELYEEARMKWLQQQRDRKNDKSLKKISSFDDEEKV